MTAQETIILLSQMYLQQFDDKKKEALAAAIYALEKQIPKKVVFESDLFELRYCPCCKVRFIGWGMKYCGECGQALDWSDTE